ncbi:MAG: hypothetical protein GXO27_04445 [Chlorobi bacterium]|nr:hypothetical protein [Chlorobiota bacterium]
MNRPARAWQRLSGMPPGLLYLPFLLFYALLAWVLAPETPFGDESRYMGFALRLLEGSYSPPPPEINLWNGPGYPLVLAAGKAPGLSWDVLRLANALWGYASLVLIHRTVRTFASSSTAVFFSLALALYPPLWQMMPYLLTEPFTWFLVAASVYTAFRHYLRPGGKNLLLAALAWGWLILTKIIFAYVTLLLWAAALIIWLRTKDLRHRAVAAVWTGALLVGMPYLIYTSALTGKFFYWSNAGGMSLYTMSTPYPDEWGDWLSMDQLAERPGHRHFIDSIRTLDPLARDRAFKQKAIENIRRRPDKYLRNWTANISRMLFNFPYTDKPQTLRTLVTLVPNLFWIPLIFLSLFIWMIHPRAFPVLLHWLAVYFIVYLAMSSLVSAYNRMFYVTLPFWAVWGAYATGCVLKCRLRKTPCRFR